MRIALIADITAPIPPAHYGGVERMVYLVLEGLVQRGHEVTLFASDDSSVPCCLVPFGHRRSQSMAVETRNLLTLFYQMVRTSGDFDIVHCFGRTLYLLPLLPLSVPKIQSYGCPLNPKKIWIAARLSRGTLTFTACSSSCAQRGNGIGRWEVIYNGISLKPYCFSPSHRDDSYLVFLGRLDRVKGVHTAIAVAKATKKRLIIAGNVAVDGKNLDYFGQEIEPNIDGEQIQYIGPVDDSQKNKLLGNAQALLFPIEWEEPFGLVMIEAMACGTPVIAFPRGAVPEIITDGVNGFVSTSTEQMIFAVGRLQEIDREQCRKTVEKRFSQEVIVSEYEKLYRQLLGM